MPPSNKDADLLIVGGGILGLWTGWLAAESDFEVLLCRRADARVPHADTLRNQCWLQSGLRYFMMLHSKVKWSRRAASEFGEEMRMAGQAMLRKLSLATEKQAYGVVRLTQAEATSWPNDAQQMDRVQVRRIDDEDARALLGALYEPGGVYYATPEVVFPEKELVEELAARLKNHKRVGIVEVDEPVTLERDRQRVSAKIQGKLYNPVTTVLAAGAGNIALVSQLRLKHPPPLLTTQTPLAVVRDCVLGHPDFHPWPQIFVDRVRNFSVVSHPPAEGLTTGASVIGVGGTWKEVTHVEPASRVVTPKEWDGVWSKLPTVLRAYKAEARCTAGVEVYVDGAHDVERCVERLRECHGVVLGTPGRATMALRVASEVLARVNESQILGNSLVTPPTGGWTEQVHMHHEDYYDGELHDVR